MDTKLAEILETQPALKQVANVILDGINTEKASLVDSFWQSCTSHNFDKDSFINRMIVLRSGEILVEESLKRIKYKIEKG